MARLDPAAAPLTPRSPEAGMPTAQGPDWDAGAGLWGGLSAGGMQARSGDVEAWAEPGAGGVRDDTTRGADPGDALGRDWS